MEKEKQKKKGKEEGGFPRVATGSTQGCRVTDTCVPIDELLD